VRDFCHVFSVSARTLIIENGKEKNSSGKKWMKMKREYWGWWAVGVYAYPIVFDAEEYTCKCPLRCH